MSRVAALFRRTFGIIKEHVGTDRFGNKYYHIPKQTTWTGRVVRARRFVEASNSTAFQYQEGNIPSEWDAWIRGRRKNPPTVEELFENERYRKDIKIKVREAEERDQALQLKEYEDGLVARSLLNQVKGHAAATPFGETESSEDPVSTASTFEPGSWAPLKK